MSYDGYHTALILGGIRSGKSAYAESLVGRAAEVRYVATGPAETADDPEWAARLAAHRARRPEGWLTEETGADPRRLIDLLGEAKPDQTVLVDDLGGWMTALLSEAGWAPSAVAEPVAALVEAVRECPARLVVVSPEVGLSVVPPTEAGRAFADALGTANRALADVCDTVALVVAGQPTWLKRAAPRTRIVPVAARPSAPSAAVVAAPSSLSGDEVSIEVGMSLPIPDAATAYAATERLRQPVTGLGKLAEVVGFSAGAQGTEAPQPYRSVRAVLLYGAHEGGLSAGDSVAGWTRRLGEVTEGGGPLGLLAAQAGVTLQIADLAAAGLPPAAPVEAGDALRAVDVETALRYGWRLAESAVDTGTDLLVLAAGGPGQEAAAVAAIAATTGKEAPALLPPVRLPAGRYDDNAWMVRCAAVRDALHRARPSARDAKPLLAALGGADLAAAVGFLLGAASRRTPVVIDGPVGVAAGLIGRDIASQVRLWLLLPDHGDHPATRAGADMLSLTPFADLGLSVGEGGTALAALPLIQSALALAELSTVDSEPAESTVDSEDDTIRA
jgi:adenosyl cobinamide kinase/adenosyl cobinamide phosphate guanylyltransferase/NaMN:DMB phosphoribosyltransferase